MPKYRVGEMQVNLGVGKELRELAPGTVVELSKEEAALIGKAVQPVRKEGGEGAE